MIIALPMIYLLRLMAKKILPSKYLIVVGFAYIAIAIGLMVFIDNLELFLSSVFIALCSCAGILIGDWCYFAKNYRDPDEKDNNGI